MHAFPRSSVLVLEDARSISSLIPSTLVDQVDALLDSHRIDDAAVLVDQRRKKLEGNLIVDPDEAEELQYAYQVIGFKCFSETLFEDAGRNLFNGSLDPRVLVSYYPALRGGLFGDESEVDVFAGVAERMPSVRNVEELIKHNLVLNYSPHLSPDSPPSLELTRVLNDAAREMLLVFLEKSRKRARVERRMEDLSVGITRVVDTVLAKLYAQSQNLAALNHLLTSSESPHDVVLSELEPILLRHSLLKPLLQLYKQHKETSKLLDLYASCVDHGDVQGGLEDPINGIFDLLLGGGGGLKHTDRKTCVKWGLWMLRRGELDRGMKLLIPPEPSTKRRDRERERDRESDLDLLNQISEANVTAEKRFLEYLVLVKRHTSQELHTRLALACIDELLQCLRDNSVLKLWRAKASSYASPRSHPHPHSYTSVSSPPPPSPSHPHPRPSSSSTSLPPPPPPPPLSSTSAAANSHFIRPTPTPTPTPSYPSQQQPFITYFASTTPDTPSKRTRLKTLFFLSGSVGYDPGVVLDRLRAGVRGESSTGEEGVEEAESGTETRVEKEKEKEKEAVSENVLALEYAILYGKLKNHAKALSTLVHTLRDSHSAEVYCTLGGEVVPVKVAWSIVESSSSLPPPPTTKTMGGELSLREWYFGLFDFVPQGTSGGGGKRTGGMGGAVLRGGGGVGVNAPAVVRQKSVKEEVKKELLTDLVGVYMRNTAGGVDQTRRLLDSQGVNLDVVDVVTLVPDTWPITSLHTFLTRYFRRTLHSSHETMILKNLSAGQNLLVRESSYPLLRDQGYVIEEPDSADEGAEGEMMIDEKTAHLQAEQIVDEKFGSGDDVPVVSEKVHETEVVVGPEDERRREEVREGEDGEDGGVIGEERSALGLTFDGGEEEEGAEDEAETRVDGNEDEDEDEDEDEGGKS